MAGAGGRRGAGLLLCVCGIFLCGACGTPKTPPARAAAVEVLRAFQENKPWPLLSRSHGILEPAQAYAVQKEYLALRQRSDGVAGYKAGLSSAGAPARFGLEEAVSGVLLGRDRIDPQGSGLYLLRDNPGTRPMLELELALVFASVPSEPPATVEELRRHIRGVAPAVEIPGIAFAGDGSFRGTDLIASNVAARHFLLGEARILEDLGGLRLPTVEVQLWRDGRRLIQGRGSDAMGDPWQAALWLTRQLMSQGWRPAAGEVLLSGALGGMTAAVPGSYRAEFGALGTLRLEIRALNAGGATDRSRAAR